MPKDSKVARCVEGLKKKHAKVNPYAVCQKSTGMSYKTGKPIKKSGRGR